MSAPVRVLQSFPTPRTTTNPYIVMLARSLETVPGVRVLTFSWRRALWERYDVVHVHWPEILTAGSSPLRTAVRRVLFAIVLLRWTLSATPVVRTWHNLRPQEGGGRLRDLLLRWTDRLTTLGVRLNDETPVPPGNRAVTIPHGHYRDWFAGQARVQPVPGQLAFVGLIRPYKDVPGLIRAFGATAAAVPGARLTIAGRPSSDALADTVRRAAEADPRVTVRLDFLEDADLVATVTGAQLVVLPYAEMHNSGAALMALSLDRPVLVPDNAVNERLAEEVGPGWVRRYAGELTGAALEAALTEGDGIPGTRPALDRRGWDLTGQQHAEAYRLALATSARTRRGCLRRAVTGRP
jgi:glycosyltransferase involved in cell wall biosynthesis